MSTNNGDPLKGKLKDPLKGKLAFGLFSNNKLEVYSLFSLAVLGLFFRMFVIPNNDMTGEQGPATSTLWGYGISSICILCILFITYGLSKKEFMEIKNFSPDIKDGFFSNISYILSDGMIFIIVLVLLALIIVLNYVYYQKINIGIVPGSFESFNYISNLFMIIQFLLIFQFINIRMFGEQNKSSMMIGIINAATYFISTINIIFVIIMYILLKYYSTDG